MLDVDCTKLVSNEVSSIVVIITNIDKFNCQSPVDWRESFMKQSVGKCK